MAAKSPVTYLCSECGWSGAKWYGRCPECGEWGTVNEFREIRLSGVSKSTRSGKTAARNVAHNVPRNVSHNSALTKTSAYTNVNSQNNSDNKNVTFSENSFIRGTSQLDVQAQPMSAIQADDSMRIPTGFSEFDRVLGGGLVPGSVTLIAGEPGIGKSTLLLETAGNIARAQENLTQKLSEANSETNSQTKAQYPAPVLYISGEESAAQVKLRASRINAVSDNLLLASTTDLDTVLALIEQYQPILAIVDSAQTIVSNDVDGITGGSTQVREVASALIDVAKSYDIPVLLVGHVTKDGSIAGPRTLEHLVDAVCQFEGDSQTALRLLRAVKNRFGPTDEVGCFDMSGDGIEEVPDPSGLFLSSNENQQNDGTCVTFTLEGHRSLPIEIQALVTNSALPSPRRAVSGADANRIAMLTAVLYRHGNVNLLSKDIYVSTIAGAVAKEPACDIAIVASLASAATGRSITSSTCAIGEISLTGQVRPVPRLEPRLREAARIGYRRAVVCSSRKKLHIPGLQIVEVANIKDALRELGL